MIAQNEVELLQECRRGEPGAFEKVYEDNFDRVYRYLSFKVQHRADVEDLTQQVFLKALESIGSFRWRGVSISAWIMKIAHNTVVDYYRDKARKTCLPLEEARMPMPDGAANDPAALAERAWSVEELNAACARLTPAQREVVSLRFAGGLSVAETAHAMGKSEGAVKVLQHEALKRLRRIMAPGEDDG